MVQPLGWWSGGGKGSGMYGRTRPNGLTDVLSPGGYRSNDTETPFRYRDELELGERRLPRGRRWGLLDRGRARACREGQRTAKDHDSALQPVISPRIVQRAGVYGEDARTTAHLGHANGVASQDAASASRACGLLWRNLGRGPGHTLPGDARQPPRPAAHVRGRSAVLQRPFHAPSYESHRPRRERHGMRCRRRLGRRSIPVRRSWDRFPGRGLRSSGRHERGRGSAAGASQLRRGREARTRNGDLHGTGLARRRPDLEIDLGRHLCDQRREPDRSRGIHLVEHLGGRWDRSTRLIPLLHDTQSTRHARESVTDQAEPASPNR
jgi:hypothetical protein